MQAQQRGLPDAPSLLLRRMMTLELNPAAVAGSEAGAFGDLRNRCAKCACTERCKRDLQSAPSAAWKTYCSNFGLLNFMTGMWWLRMLR